MYLVLFAVSCHGFVCFLRHPGSVSFGLPGICLQETELMLNRSEVGLGCIRSVEEGFGMDGGSRATR